MRRDFPALCCTASSPRRGSRTSWSIQRPSPWPPTIGFKTDRRDAKKLALELADGRLRRIHIPTEAEELARLLPRTRAQIVEHRATLARQIKAKLYQFGLIAPASRRLISSRY